MKALGIALLGLPPLAGAFPLSHAAYRPQETPAQAAPLRSEVAVEKRSAPASPGPRSQHRDDESGAVIREIRMGEGGGARTVHCHGHAFPAKEGYLTKR